MLSWDLKYLCRQTAGNPICEDEIELLQYLFMALQ